MAAHCIDQTDTLVFRARGDRESEAPSRSPLGPATAPSPLEAMTMDFETTAGTAAQSSVEHARHLAELRVLPGGGSAAAPFAHRTAHAPNTRAALAIGYLERAGGTVVAANLYHAIRYGSGDGDWRQVIALRSVLGRFVDAGAQLTVAAWQIHRLFDAYASQPAAYPGGWEAMDAQLRQLAGLAPRRVRRKEPMMPTTTALEQRGRRS